jgi:putative heme-binding domain-containing protein
MKDGRTVTGLVAEQTANGITLVDSEGQRTLLRRGEIKEITPSEVSLMPEALLDPLSPQQVRDLFRYLQAEEKP